MAKKIYVLDTNVLIADPQSIFKFAEHDIVVPMVVLEELDSFKSEMTERGRASRTCSRIFDSLREKGNLFYGIHLGEFREDVSGTIKVINCDSSILGSLPVDLRKDKADTIILATAMTARKEHNPTYEELVLVTQDVNLRVKADALGIKAESYKSGSLQTKDFYKGYREISVTQEQLNMFYGSGSLDVVVYVLDQLQDVLENEYVILKSPTNGSGLGRYSSGKIQALYSAHGKKFKKNTPSIWNISPKNAQQQFALDALLDDSISLVTLAGTAGTGKTILAIAAGLYLAADEAKYNKVLAARPIFPLGRDIGYLPGDKSEKLNPWMSPLFDNIDLLLSLTDEMGKKKKGYQELINMGILEIEALTYVRGRSIPKQFILIDESQNLSLHEAKTIITRAGEGSKIILTGDPDQIDNPLLDRSNNGLSYVISKFRGQKLSAHVTLEKGERSELATLAAEIM